MYTTNIAQSRCQTTPVPERLEQKRAESLPQGEPGQDEPFRAIACGNAFQGDWGVAFYALEALRQEELGQNTGIEYIASEYHYLLYALYQARVAVVALPACVTGHAGMIRAWNWTKLAEYVRQGGQSWELRALARAVACVELADALPPELLFLIIETRPSDAVGLTAQGRALARKTVRRVLEFLARHGLETARRARNAQRLYQIPWLQTSF
jgi:hypothetical protein